VKGVLAWIKSRLLVVICCVLIVILLPAGYIVSGMLNKGIQKRAEDSFKTEQRRLRGSSSVTYTLPAIFEGEESISDSRAPNARVTAFYERAREERTRQVGEVVEAASSFNRKGRVPLVDGLLPAPADERDRRLAGEMARMISGEEVGDGRLPLMRAMLRDIGAKSAIPAEDLASSLFDYQQQQEQEMRGASPNGRLSDEQEEKLAEELRRRRLSAYASHANGLSLYATPDAFRVSPAPGQGFIPLEPDPRQRGYTEDDAFRWQFDLWVFEDVIRAIGEANGDDGGVADSVVKRVEAVHLLPYEPNAQDGTILGAPSTHTERKTEKTNQVYDVRHGEMIAVVSAERLPAFIDAMGRANFMTVTGVRVSSVDTWADLQEGYYYGPEAVVRVNLTFESVYLRDWLAQYMPESVRTALGVTLPGEEQNTEADD
jgi:hypothetical protein